ncbi:hypothetical protein ES705_39708 [subsurface metagenome]
MVEGQVEKIELDEISRVYIFPNNQELEIKNAKVCYVNANGTHRLQNEKGEIYIVPYKWIAMKYIPIVKDKKSKNEISKK